MTYTIHHDAAAGLLVATDDDGNRVGAAEWFRPLTASSDSWEIATELFQRQAIASVEHDRDAVFVTLK